jgi:hypothetical protein
LSAEEVGKPKSKGRRFRLWAESPTVFVEFTGQKYGSMVDHTLVDALVKQGLELSSRAGGELERSCWMVVHEHIHGVKPSEYDIQPIDEDLYLAVLKAARQL